MSMAIYKQEEWHTNTE